MRYKHHIYTIEDIARAIGKTPQAVRQDIYRNKLRIDDLTSVSLYVVYNLAKQR